MSVGVEGFILAQVAALRERSALLGGYGAREASEALQKAASELEASFRAWWLSELSVSEAATEAGYSQERMRELIREGRIEGERSGKAGPFRVRRCDLPRKPALRQSEPLRAVAQRLGIR